MRTLLASTIAVTARAMSTSQHPKAAIAQLTSTGDKLGSLRSIAKCAALAKSQGACMLFLPECFGFIGSSSDETLENAEDLEAVARNNESITNWLKAAVLTGEGDAAAEVPKADATSSVSLMDGLRTIAQSTNLWISGGGIHEIIPGEDRVFNTHVILNSQGETVCKYRKIHLFDVSIPGKVELKESRTTKAGDVGLQCCETPLGKIGLTTCYDLRFPEQYTELAKMGAQIVLVPSAFTVPTGSAHWHILLQARAIETQCYVLAAAQVGRHNVKRESYGHALAVNPWGEIVADAGDTESPTTIICEIDQDRLNDIRLRMPIQQHRQAAEGLLV